MNAIETLAAHLSPTILGILSIIIAIILFLSKKRASNISASLLDFIYDFKITNLDKIIESVSDSQEQKAFYTKVKYHRIFNWFSKSSYRWPTALLIQDIFSRNIITEGEIKKCKGRFFISSNPERLCVRTSSCTRFFSWTRILSLFIISAIIAIIDIVHVTSTSGAQAPVNMENITMSAAAIFGIVLAVLFITFLIVYFWISSAFDYLYIIEVVAKRLDDYYKNKLEDEEKEKTEKQGP